MAKKTGLVLFTLLFIMALFSGCVISPRRNPDGSLANPTPTPTPTGTPTATPTPTPVPTPTPTPTPATATGKLYVTSRINNQIFRFDNAFTADANVAPGATITGVATTLSGPITVALDAVADRLYVPNHDNASILVFDGASTLAGTVNQAPTRIISGPTTLLTVPEQVVLDKTHDLLYVADDIDVYVYSPASTITGDKAPARHLIVGFTSTAILLDVPNDRLYLADGTGNAINIYDSASTLNGTVTPNRQITGAAAALGQPVGLQLDSTSRLIVSNSAPPSINVYATAAGTIAGNLAPAFSISGSATGFIAPSQIAYDPSGSGTLYVADPGAAKILIFGSFNASTGGNVTPSRAISGASTGLTTKSSNSGIALDTTR